MILYMIDNIIWTMIAHVSSHELETLRPREDDVVPQVGTNVPVCLGTVRVKRVISSGA